MAQIKSIPERCIKHSQKYHVRVRKDYVEMMDHDHCSAILLALFEYLTEGEIARKRIASEPGEPWVKASAPRIVEGLLGLYSQRAIHERLQFLRYSGLLLVHQQPGVMTQYQIAIEAVNEALEKRKVFVFDPCKIAGVPADGNFAVEDEPPAKPSAKLQGSDDLSISVLEEGRKDAATTDDQTQSSSEESQPLTEEGVATFRDFRVVWEKAIRRLSPGDRAVAQEYFATLTIGAAEIKSAVERYAVWLKARPNIRSPLGVFFGDPRRWADFAPKEADGHLATPNGHSNAPAPPKSQRGASLEASLAAKEWEADQSFMGFVEKYRSNGASAKGHDLMRGHVKWLKMSEEERALANERIVSANDPAYALYLHNYLITEEYTRKPRPKPKPSSNDQASMAARALAILEEKKKQEGRA